MRTRAVEVIETTLGPLRGAKFSMRTELSFRGQLPRNGSRGGPDGLANVVHDPFHEGRIVAFGHDPNEGFGARFADHEPSAALKLGLGCSDSLPDNVGYQRLGAAVEADVLEYLRKRFAVPPHLARRLFRLDQRCKHLKTRHQPVAGRGVVSQDDVPGLLAANNASRLSHLLQYVAVAHFGTDELQP